MTGRRNAVRLGGPARRRGFRPGRLSYGQVFSIALPSSQGAIRNAGAWIMTKRKELKAALAKAEAALANAVAGAAGFEGARAAANANIEKLRAYCRRARAALIEMKLLDSTARSNEEFDIHIRQLLESSRQIPDASPPSRQSSRKHPVRANRNRSQDESGRREPVRRFNAGFLVLELPPGGALARGSLIRQAIGLSALMVAYLEYFYIDVQLQIASLASIFG